jgi:ParB-like chromosome segregation protein Spo0J
VIYHCLVDDGKRSANPHRTKEVKMATSKVNKVTVKAEVPVIDISGIDVPPLHPACSAFPQMDNRELSDLIEDIRKNGQIDPIVMTIDGEILDGRNRYLACRYLKIEPRIVQFDDNGDPVKFAMSRNIVRRSLSPSQRSMIAGKLEKVPAHRPKNGEPLKTLTIEQIAMSLNIDPTMVKSGRAVQEKAAPHIVQMVEKGEVSVRDAADVVRKATPDEQATMTTPEAVKTAAKAKRTKTAAKPKVAIVKADSVPDNAVTTPVVALTGFKLAPVTPVVKLEASEVPTEVGRAGDDLNSLTHLFDDLASNVKLFAGEPEARNDFVRNLDIVAGYGDPEIVAALVADLRAKLDIAIGALADIDAVLQSRDATGKVKVNATDSFKVA